MELKNNKKITIAIANHRKSYSWANSEMLWSEFVESLQKPVKTTESYEDYMKLKKSEQDELKDVGGFVGGKLAGPRRKNQNVISRDLITLDLDNIANGETDNVIKTVNGLNCAYVMYSTRKHVSFAPRLRIIIPLDRPATVDEYEPIARMLAKFIGIHMADPTTFEVARMMFFPSISSDGEYVYMYQDREFCSTDGVLGLYDDWKDTSQWPQVPGHDISEQRHVARQQNPTTKSGVVGAFCRSYDIHQAIEKFIPKAYEKTTKDDRYTYLGGTIYGGAIVYDNLFLYSHHASDPCSNQLVNAFDLVRLHLFGELDEDAKEGTPVVSLPSYHSMRQLALSDEKVIPEMMAERNERVKEAFGDSNENEIDTREEIDYSLEDNTTGVISKLAKSPKTGLPNNTIDNIVQILNLDNSTKGKIALDEFANRGMVLGPLPWNKNKEKRIWTDVDDAELERFLELKYGITGQDRINKGLTIVSAQHKFNDVKNYLESLNWDGVNRIDTMLHDYLGAEQSVYTADVMRKSLTAAVSRAIMGGTKYDYMPILSGPQGIGKSTFLRVLGQDWFSDSLQCFEGKEAAELVQGTWINELPELTGLTKSEVSAVKQFLSKQDDIYREAYGRRTNKYPRRCVFFGTTNDSEYLKDATGNRRFWPVDVGIEKPKLSVFNDLEIVRDQIWAEAYQLWVYAEPLYLSGESKKIAEEMQELHQETNATEGLIKEFIDKPVTSNWNDLSLQARRMFWAGNLNLPENVTLVPREKICALEIWCECLGGDPKYMKRRDSIEINNILGNLKGWERNKSKRRYGYCGTQRGFEKTSEARLEDANKNMVYVTDNLNDK